MTQALNEHMPQNGHEGHEGHEGAGASHGHDSVIQWPQVAASFVSFAVLFAILVRLLRKPLSIYLQTHSAEIRSAIEEAKQLKEGAEQKQREYEARLKNLDAEFSSLRANLIQAGQKERDRILSEAEHRAARMRADVQFVISQDVKQLKEQVVHETARRVLDAAHEVLEKHVTPADHERFAEAFLEQLKRVHTHQMSDPVRSGGGRISSLPPAYTSRSTALSARSSVISSPSSLPTSVQEKT